MNCWQMRADTGGTFTDCLAIDPGGNPHRAKVLSSSALRGRILSRTTDNTVQIDVPWVVPTGFLRGYTLRILGAAGVRFEALRVADSIGGSCGRHFRGLGRRRGTGSGGATDHGHLVA